MIMMEVVFLDGSNFTKYDFKLYNQFSQAHNAKFYIGETNSVGCGGVNNMSNVFAAAIWSVDWLFTAASLNISGINFHTGSKNYYDVLSFGWTQSNHLITHPLYYGMYLFAYATRTKSSFINLNVVSSEGKYIKSWAVLDATDQTIRVVTLHKDYLATGPCTVTLSLPSSYSYSSSAKLSVLTADSPYEQFNIFFSGLTWGTTDTGFPAGNFTPTTIYSTTISNNRVFNFDMQPFSASVLEIQFAAKSKIIIS